MSAPLPVGVSHLVIADDALIPSRWGSHITLCGLEVRRPNVEYEDPDLDWPNYHYCPACVGEAARWSAEAGQTAGGRPVTELAAVTDPDATCPVCWSGEAVRQTSCTPRVEAWACDRCDSRWAITVANPLPFLDGIAAAVAECSVSETAATLAAVSGARDDDNQPRGYFIGECGHRVPLVGPICYVGPCDDCDPSAT